MAGTPHDPRLRVALETTLLLHGVPREAAPGLARDLAEIVSGRGGIPTLIGVVKGQPVIGLSTTQLNELLAAPAGSVGKLNTANLGAALFHGLHGATTVSTTIELAARAGIAVFATGGLGGVHFPAGGRSADAATSGTAFDVSTDLFALTRWPVAVVASGVKSILDIAATREVLETLGVPVVGFQTDEFPAFYLRRSPTQRVGKVDVRFDDPREIGSFVRSELARTNRCVLVCNPIPAEHELSAADWSRWLAEAEHRVHAARATRQGADGRDATPSLLAALHDVSGGATLRANIELVKSNAALAGDLARAMLR